MVRFRQQYTVDENSRLTDREREDVFRAVADHMRRYPARSARRGSPVADALVSIVQPLRQIPVAVAIFLLSGASGVAAAAQKALPGDAFYSTKINVLEPLESGIVFTSRNRASVSARLLTRRLQEAAVLAEHGWLTSERRMELSVSLRRLAGSTNDLIHRLEQESDLDAAASISASYEEQVGEYRAVLRAHVLDSSGSGATVETELQTLLTDVDHVASDATETRMDAENKMRTQGMDGSRLATLSSLRAASHTLQNVDGMLHRLQHRLAPETLVAISDALTAARASLTEAERQFAAGSYVQTLTQSRDAFRRAEQVHALIVQGNRKWIQGRAAGMSAARTSEKKQSTVFTVGYALNILENRLKNLSDALEDADPASTQSERASVAVEEAKNALAEAKKKLLEGSVNTAEEALARAKAAARSAEATMHRTEVSHSVIPEETLPD
jgi:hypothetical protein